jgi:hypothetical protein
MAKRGARMKKATVASKKEGPKQPQPKATAPRAICFTIMPFGDRFDQYYREVFQPAIEQAGFTPRRADDLMRPGTIVRDIWNYTKEATIILADLTGRNPNVLYELGLAHAIAKPAILVAESIEDIPFDLRHLRVLQYDKNTPNWGEVLKTNIAQSIKEVVEAPLSAVLPAFLEADELRDKKRITRRDKELIELRQELQGLKLQWEEHFEREAFFLRPLDPRRVSLRDFAVEKTMRPIL